MAKETPTRCILLAEFDSAGDCMHGAEKLNKAGYRFFDAHTPFPVHGMDKAMGLPDSRMGWIVLAMAFTGLTAAIAMITYMNGIDYPLIIGGKPAISIPAYVPVCFELTVLFSAFGAVFGMFAMNRLPRHNHPLFESERFRAVTDDKFFLAVESIDPKFHPDETRKILQTANAKHFETIETEDDL